VVKEFSGEIIVEDGWQDPMVFLVVSWEDLGGCDRQRVLGHQSPADRKVEGQ